ITVISHPVINGCKSGPLWRIYSIRAHLSLIASWVMTTIRKGSIRMMPASPRYCDACGAANQTQATRCWACGQRFAASTEHTGSASSLPAEQPAPPPALLVGRYRIIGIIGTGGFGAVYQAQDK